MLGYLAVGVLIGPNALALAIMKHQADAEGQERADVETRSRKPHLSRQSVDPVMGVAGRPRGAAGASQLLEHYRDLLERRSRLMILAPALALGLLAGLSDQDPSERDSKGARDAFDAFKELLQRFPEGKYTADATARMKYLVNSLAWNDVHVARYYMKRGAYIAAANRAQSALTTYPGAPALEEALFIMVKAYDALGMKDLRDDAERVMLKNFPHSKYLKGDGGKPAASWWRIWN